MWALGHNVDPRINKPPPLTGDHNRDPDIKALKRRGVINQGSTLGLGFLVPLESIEVGSGSIIIRSTYAP